MQQDDRQVERAQIGEVGVIVSLNGEKLSIGWDVFWIPKQTNPDGTDRPEPPG
jgi:hypothetical protein